VNFGIAVEGSFRDAILAAVRAEDGQQPAVPVAAAKPPVVNAAAAAGTAVATATR
jgi:hypothetical protein